MSFKFMNRDHISSIECICNRYSMHYYHRLQSLELDFSQLVRKTIETRCKNELARNYLRRVEESVIKHLQDKRSEFKERWCCFYEHKFIQNQVFPRAEGGWCKYAGAKRQYYMIEDYKIVTSTDMGQMKADSNESPIGKADPMVVQSAEY